MTLRITEAGLATADVKFVNEVLVAAPGTTESGITVYKRKLLAPFVGQHAEVAVAPYHQLIVEVDDPEDPDTQDRIRMKVQNRMLAKP